MALGYTCVLLPLREIWFRAGLTSHSPIEKSPCKVAFSSSIIFAREVVRFHLDQEYVTFTATFCSRTSAGFPAAIA